MIEVALSPSLRESARRRHLNALLTLPQEFRIVSQGADVEVAERSAPRGSAGRRVLVGPPSAGDSAQDVADTPVDWDRAVLDFVDRVSPFSDAIRAVTVTAWSNTADAPHATIDEALVDAELLASRILPAAEVGWVTTTAAAAQSRSAPWGPARVILSAVESVNPARRMRVQLVGDGVAASLEVRHGDSARPSTWSIVRPEGSTTSTAPFSSSARELWMALAAGR